ncbi:hypothetical protein HDV00_006106 [Rhizophlyctis rosea]|nr:hypothetical protein HDV00_006106 [Rhizophlyctis rosea]
MPKRPSSKKQLFVPARLEKLVNYFEERRRIKLRRQADLPAPWTQDPILQIYRFCCIRREDDKTSRLVMNEYFRNPNPYKETHFFFSCMFHEFLCSAMMSFKVGYIRTQERLLEVMDEIRDMEDNGVKWRPSVIQACCSYDQFYTAMLHNWDAAEKANKLLYPPEKEGTGDLPTLSVV